MTETPPEAPPAPTDSAPPPTGGTKPAFKWQERQLPEAPSEHVGSTGDMSLGLPTGTEDPEKEPLLGYSDEALEELVPPPDEPSPPEKRLSVEETMSLLQGEGFTVKKHERNSLQPTTPTEMTPADHTPSKPSLIPPDERGRLKTHPLESEKPTSWLKQKSFWAIGITMISVIGFIVWFFKPDDDVQLSEVVNTLANQKANLENDKAGLLTKLGEAEAKAEAVEELRVELATVRKLAEKPIDISTLLEQPLGTARIEEILKDDKSALSAIVRASVNTLVFQETPVTINGAQGTMFLAFDEDGVGVIQFTPKTSAVAETPPEQ